MAGTMIACNGWLDVLLYASTRADIVFCDLPPGEATGLNTFNFMGRQLQASPTRQFANTGARNKTSGQNDYTRALGLRSQETQSPENQYGLEQMELKDDVAVSVDSLAGNSIAIAPVGNDTMSSPHASSTWDSRHDSSLRSSVHKV